MMTFRELRLWHWNECQAHRTSANKETTYAEAAKRRDNKSGVAYHQRRAVKFNGAADFHISAVQTLNDVPCLSFSTAEDDAKC